MFVRRRPRPGRPAIAPALVALAVVGVAACAGGFEPYDAPAEAGVFATVGDASAGRGDAARPDLPDGPSGPPSRPGGADAAPDVGDARPGVTGDVGAPIEADARQPPSDAGRPPPDAGRPPQDAAPPTAPPTEPPPPPPDAAVSPCPGGRPPEDETCNGRDDDCNGAVDEGPLCGDDARCEGGECVTHRWVFEAEGGATGHDVGFAERGGWACNTAACGRGVMVYGPYTRALDAGTYQARFRLRTDNVIADNGSVVRIEVNDFDGRVPDCGQCVLAQRDVRRREFPAPMADYDAALDFEIPAARAGHRLEFRTVFLDIAYVFEDRIEVVRR